MLSNASSSKIVATIMMSLMPAALVTADTLSSIAYSDAGCSAPIVAQYVNGIKQSDVPSVQTGLCTPHSSMNGVRTRNEWVSGNGFTMDTVPNVNNGAKIQVALWKKNSGSCGGTPPLIMVYYQDTPSLQAKCNADTLVVTNNGKTDTTKASGCKIDGAGIPGSFKCLKADASMSSSASESLVTVPGMTAMVLGAALSCLI